jgi:hypothetical protein
MIPFVVPEAAFTGKKAAFAFRRIDLCHRNPVVENRKLEIGNWQSFFFQGTKRVPIFAPEFQAVSCFHVLNY